MECSAMGGTTRAKNCPYDSGQERLRRERPIGGNVSRRSPLFRRSHFRTKVSEFAIVNMFVPGPMPKESKGDGKYFAWGKRNEPWATVFRTHHADTRCVGIRKPLELTTALSPNKHPNRCALFRLMDKPLAPRICFALTLAAASCLAFEVPEECQSPGACSRTLQSRKQTPTGPFLGGIGTRYNRTELCESILKPNVKIAQGFETQWLKTGTTKKSKSLPPREVRATT